MNTLGKQQRSMVIAFLVVVVGALLLIFGRQFFYFFRVVNPDEIGVKFQAGTLDDVVGPGVYSDFGLFVSLRTISTRALSFQVTDPEIITRDKQRIGLVVSGDIFRPGLGQKDVIEELWPLYGRMYLDETALLLRVSDLAKQAMKVCVGDRKFDESIVGTSRDDLRSCIDTELDDLVGQLGLQVKNVVVPEVVLSAEVQVALDAIVQSRLATEKAAQDQLKAQAEALAEQAKQEGVIRVEQSRIQEQTRQQTALAQLEQERLLAQKAVIEAERLNDLAKLETQRQVIEATKANELLTAQRDLQINRAAAEAAVEKARADLAMNLQLAQLYAQYPDYVQLLAIQANASALTATDKIIFTQEGTTPTIVIPGPGIVPTVETTPTPQ